MKIDHRRKVHKKHLNNMLEGAQNYCAAANLANNNLKSGTDFSIAAIMGESSREPSERSISICHIYYYKKHCNIYVFCVHELLISQHIINLIKKHKNNFDNNLKNMKKKKCMTSDITSDYCPQFTIKYIYFFF